MGAPSNPYVRFLETRANFSSDPTHVREILPPLMEVIQRWRGGAVRVAGEAMGKTCEGCGLAISVGKYCEACLMEMDW